MLDGECLKTGVAVGDGRLAERSQYGAHNVCAWVIGGQERERKRGGRREGRLYVPINCPHVVFLDDFLVLPADGHVGCHVMICASAVIEMQFFLCPVDFGQRGGGIAIS